MSDDIKSTIINLYTKNGYYERYGVDVIVSFIIIYSFILCITYFHVMNHLPILRKNWPANKCNPIYIPFAGHVIKDSDKSKLDIVGDNFNSCVQNVLISISDNAFAPITILLYAWYILSPHIACCRLAVAKSIIRNHIAQQLGERKIPNKILFLKKS